MAEYPVKFELLRRRAQLRTQGGRSFPGFFFAVLCSRHANLSNHGNVVGAGLQTWRAGNGGNRATDS